jgi:hypothetical protein
MAHHILPMLLSVSRSAFAYLLSMIQLTKERVISFCCALIVVACFLTVFLLGLFGTCDRCFCLDELRGRFMLSLSLVGGIFSILLVLSAYNDLIRTRDFWTCVFLSVLPYFFIILIFWSPLASFQSEFCHFTYGLAPIFTLSFLCFVYGVCFLIGFMIVGAMRYYLTRRIQREFNALDNDDI